MYQIIIYYASYLEPMTTIGFNLIMTMILCGFSIDLGDEFGASLESKMRSYMGTKDWDNYLKESWQRLNYVFPMSS